MPDYASSGKRGSGWQRMKWSDNITNLMDMNLSKLWGIVEDRGAWHATVRGVPESWTQLSTHTYDGASGNNLAKGTYGETKKEETGLQTTAT